MKLVAPNLDNGMPSEDYYRGDCPECGRPLISLLFYDEGKGYIIRWRCWGKIKDAPECDYERVL